MLDLSQWLFIPIVIDQRRVVLIPDVVGPIPVAEQHNYVELSPAGTLCPAIAVREQDVEDVRKKHPDIAVFGIWQVLIHSGLVSVTSTLQVLQTSAWDGYYLFNDMGRIQYSGVYEAGFFAADTSFNLKDADAIHFTTSQLSLPSQAARLARELHQERQQRVKSAWLSCAVSVVLIALGGAGLDAGIHFTLHAQHQEYQLKSVLLRNAQHGLDELRATRLIDAPDDTQALTWLAAIWSLHPDVRTQQNQSLNTNRVHMMAKDQGFDPSVRFAWLAATYQPQGDWLLTFDR